MGVFSDTLEAADAPTDSEDAEQPDTSPSASSTGTTGTSDESDPFLNEFDTSDVKADAGTAYKGLNLLYVLTNL